MSDTEMGKEDELEAVRAAQPGVWPPRLDFGQILPTVTRLQPGAPGPSGRDPS